MKKKPKVKLAGFTCAYDLCYRWFKTTLWRDKHMLTCKKRTDSVNDQEEYESVRDLFGQDKPSPIVEKFQVSKECELFLHERIPKGMDDCYGKYQDADHPSCKRCAAQKLCGTLTVAKAKENAKLVKEMILAFPPVATMIIEYVEKEKKK